MPLDRGVIDQQLNELGEGARWWDHREFRDLPAILLRDERLLAITRGKVARPRWLRRTWLVVVTDRRLLCVRSGARSGWRQLDLPVEQITRVALRIGPLRGRVLVAANGRSYRLSVPKEDAYKVQAALASTGAMGREGAARRGPAHMVRRVVDHVLALPAVALEPQVVAPKPAARPAVREDDEAMKRRLELLEQHVQELDRQVDFLEQLLRERHPSPGLEEGRRTG